MTVAKFAQLVERAVKKLPKGNLVLRVKKDRSYSPRSISIYRTFCLGTFENVPWMKDPVFSSEHEFKLRVSDHSLPRHYGDAYDFSVVGVDDDRYAMEFVDDTVKKIGSWIEESLKNA